MPKNGHIGSPSGLPADPASRRRLWADRVTEKLEEALRDPDLNVALGGYVSQMIVPALVSQGKLTPEQGDRVIEVTRRTLAETSSKAGYSRGEA